MRSALLLGTFFYVSSMLLFAETAIETADRLYDEELHKEGYAYLVSALKDPHNEIQPAELYWRLSRVTKEIGDIAERKGAESSELVSIFEEAESYASRAIDLDAESYWGYYWKSANIARLAASKGFMKSIFLIKPMKEAAETALRINPRHSNSYYLLSIMYKSAPGRPIAFGSVDFAVSLCRKAIDLNRIDNENGKADLDLWYHLELARHLGKRDWDEKKRIKKQPEKAREFAQAEGELEASFYYEGTVDIGDRSDMAEAIEILVWLTEEYENKKLPKETERLAYKEAQALLSELLK